MKYSLTIVFVLFCISFSFGQLEKTFHQTFEIGETASIALDLYGEYEIEFWAGTNLMTETKVELYNSSPSIFNHFIEKEKRYVIEADTTGGVFTLRSHDKKRVPIRTRTGECFEIARLKVFVPEKFYLENPNTLMLK